MLKKLKSLVICHWLLIAILIIASFLRLHNFTELPPGLYPDEAMNGNNAIEAWESRDWKVFYTENFGREGLFINIQSLFIAALGREPWILRLPSAIFGILTVLGLYLFTKELFKDKKLALLAAFLLATSFWHINFSRIGFRAIMAPAFLVWSLYFIFLSFRKFQQSLVTGHWSLVIAAIGGLLYGLGFYSYIAYRATPLLILVIAYLISKTHPYKLEFVRMKFLIFSIAAIVVCLPLGSYFWNHPQDFFGRTTGISVFNSETLFRDLAFNKIKTLGMFNFAGDFNWRHNIAGRPLLFWPVGIFFLIGVIEGVKAIIKNVSSFKFYVLFLWFFTAFIPVVVSNEGLPHALRSLLMAPPVFILAAIGGLKIYELLSAKINRNQLLITSYLLLSLLIFESYVTYFITWGQHPAVKNAFSYNDSVIAQQLNTLPPETPKYIVVSGTDRRIERDYPISLQSVLFLTDTFTEEKRRAKSFFYLTPEEFFKASIPSDALVIKL